MCFSVSRVYFAGRSTYSTLSHVLVSRDTATNGPLAYHPVCLDTPKKHSAYNSKSARLYGPNGEQPCHVVVLVALDSSVMVVRISRVLPNGSHCVYNTFSF